MLSNVPVCSGAFFETLTLVSLLPESVPHSAAQRQHETFDKEKYAK